MPNKVFEQYREAQILSASPLELVNLLYRGGLEAVRAARVHLSRGEVAGRSRQVHRAWEILQELVRALDPERGGVLGRDLAALYVYMQQRLIDANTQQSAAPLDEVENLLTTLAEAWREIAVPAAPVPEPPRCYQPLSYSC